MPYPGLHHKVTVYGDAYSGAEQWSFGWRMVLGGDGDAGAQARAAALGPVVSSFWTDTGAAGFWATHRLQGVKVAIINEEGLYPEGHVAGEVFFANVPGGQATTGLTLPAPQNSVCCTLMTAVPRGLASKGRFFLPPISANPGLDGLLTDTVRDAVVTKVRNFLTAVNNAEAGDADVAIFSRGRVEKTWNPTTEKIEYSYPNPGAWRLVTRLEVGRVIDTQRRRRRQLVESREGAALG